MPRVLVPCAVNFHHEREMTRNKKQADNPVKGGGETKKAETCRRCSMGAQGKILGQAHTACISRPRSARIPKTRLVGGGGIPSFVTSFLFSAKTARDSLFPMRCIAERAAARDDLSLKLEDTGKTREKWDQAVHEHLTLDKGLP